MLAAMKASSPLVLVCLLPLALAASACAEGHREERLPPLGEVASEVGKVRCELNQYNCTVPNFEKVANKDTNRKYNEYDKTYYWDLENQPELKDGVGNVRGHVKGQARFNFGQRKTIGGASHLYAWAVALVEGGSASGWVREDSVHRVSTIGKMLTAAPGKPDGGFYETDWVVTGGDINDQGELLLNAKYGDRKVNPNAQKGEAASDYLTRQWDPATKVGYVNHLYNIPGTGGMTDDTLPLCVHFKRFKTVNEVTLELYFFDSASQSDLKLHFDFGEINGRRGWMTKEMLTPAGEVTKLHANHPCRVKPVPPPPVEPPPVTPPQRPTGYFDGAGCTALDGWAQDGDEPAKAIEAQLYFGAPGAAGVTVPLSAGRPRADLCGPLGSCEHGFSVFSPYSLFDGGAHEVHAFGIDTSDGSAAELQASPKTMTCALPPLAGVRRRIASPDIMEEWGFDTFFDLAPFPAAAVDALPTGTDLPAVPTLVRAEDALDVYLVDGDKKRHVTSVDSADAWHLDLLTVQIKPAAEIAALATGPALPLRPLLATDSQKTISVVDTGSTTPEPPPVGGGGGAAAAGSGGAGVSAGGSAGGPPGSGGSNASGKGGAPTSGKAGAPGASGASAGKGGTGASGGKAGSASSAGASVGKGGGAPQGGASGTAPPAQGSTEDGSCSLAAGADRSSPFGLALASALLFGRARRRVGRRS